MGIEALIDAVGHSFADASLLDQALAHRSWCAENGDAPSNERLEFLGDAILGAVVADLVFRRYPELSEGQLTNIRKAVVNATALAEVARSIELGSYIKLGRGERAANGHDKPSILSDALEAVIGAVYLDSGPAVAAAVVTRLMTERLDAAAINLGELDEKSRLQEMVASAGMGPPVYEVRSEGPDHAQRFFATVVVDGEVLGEGEGTSKKAAERVAAAEACERVTLTATPSQSPSASPTS